eukprot:3940740-Rhodomonas_salina.4
MKARQCMKCKLTGTWNASSVSGCHIPPSPPLVPPYPPISVRSAVSYCAYAPTARLYSPLPTVLFRPRPHRYFYNARYLSRPPTSQPT